MRSCVHNDWIHPVANHQISLQENATIHSQHERWIPNRNLQQPSNRIDEVSATLNGDDRLSHTLQLYVSELVCLQMSKMIRILCTMLDSTTSLIHSPMNMNREYEYQILELTTSLKFISHLYLMVLECISNEMDWFTTIENLIHQMAWKETWNHSMTEMVTISVNNRYTLRFCPPIIALWISYDLISFTFPYFHQLVTLLQATQSQRRILHEYPTIDHSLPIPMLVSE